MTALVLHTPEKLRPAVLDIIRAIAEDYPEITQVAEWREGMSTLHPTLFFNVDVPPEFEHGVKTMSQKQVLAKASAVTELSAALDLLFKPRKLRAFNYIVDPYTNLDKLMGNIVVVDIETGGDIDTWKQEEMWLLCVSVYDGKNLFVFSEEWLTDKANQDNLTMMLTNQKRKLVAHNMKFDFPTISTLLGVKILGHMDTMLLHHAMNMGAGEHGLKPLCFKYLGAPDWDKHIKKYVKGSYKVMPTQYHYPKDAYEKYVAKLGRVKVGYEAIPRDILHKYNALDVYWTWHLMEYLLEHADQRQLDVALHEYRMSRFFMELERNGVAINWEQIDRLSELFDVEEATLRQELIEMSNDPGFNPGSPAQVEKLLTDSGYPVPKTDAKTLTKLIEDPKTNSAIVVFCEKLLAFRGVSKKRSTYVKAMKTKHHESRIYTTYNVHGTNTGRLSSTNPNIQNIPRDKELRNLFTVDNQKTHKFLEVDYSQAELRVMAVISGDEYLISLFQPGMPDFFDSLLPVTFPHHDIDSWSAQERKDNRAKLKSVVYGLSYGREAPAIAVELKISHKEAQQIINNYLKAAPKFAQWRKDIMKQAIRSDGVIETVFKRRYQAEIITGTNKTNVVNSAMAFVPQSTASDICVLAGIEIQKWIGDYDAMLIGSIHDALNAEVPNEHVLEVAERMQYEMKEAARRVFGDVVPFDTDAEWGTQWGALGKDKEILNG